MNSKAPPLVAIGGLLLLAGLAFWWFGTAPTPGPVTAGPLAATNDARDDSVDTATLGGDAVVQRSAVATARTDRASLPASVTAALCGYTGRVVTSAGQPVPDSLVELYRLAADVMFQPAVGVFADGPTNAPDIEAGTARTGADGRFVIEGAFPHAFFMLRADADGDAPTWKILDETPDPGALVDLGDVVLADCGVLTGVVVGADGSPVPDALVRAVDFPDPGGFLLAQVPLDRLDMQGGVILDPDIQADLVVTPPDWAAERFETLPIPTTRTAADGSFRLTGVVPGGNLFVIAKPRLVSHVRPLIRVDAGEEKDLGEIRMREGEIAGGIVVDAAGEPVVGAEVLVASKSRLIPVHFASHADPTDAEGRFEMTGFPPGDVYGAARRRPGEPWTVAGPVGVSEELVITLPGAHTLTLNVLDPDGEPVPEPRLQLTPGHDGSIEASMFGAVRPLALDDRLTRDAERRIVIRDVPAGEYTLLATAPECAVTSARLTIDADLEHTVELVGQLEFEVVATDTEGAPVVGASVYVIARGERPRVPEAPVHGGTTGEDGRVVIDAVRGTEVRVTASHPAYGNVHARGELPSPSPIAVVFPAPGSIEGNLLEDGAVPEPGKWMVVLIANGRGSGAMPDMPRVVAPGLDGRFRAAGLSPGGYLVTVVRSATMLSSPGKSVDLVTALMLSGETPREQVELPPGGTVQVALDALAEKRVEGPSARVSGTLTIDGRLGSAYLVEGRGGRHRNAVQVDDQGRFDLGPMPAGSVRVRVRARPGNNLLDLRRMRNELWSETIELVEGQDRSLDIEVRTTAIGGLVVGADGTPVAGADVRIVVRAPAQFATDAEGAATIRTLDFRDNTDADGRFSFEQVPAGEFDVRVRADGGRAALTGLRAEPGVGRRDLQLRLVELPEVVGRVDLTIFGSERPDWMGLWFQPTGEGSAEGAWIGIGDDGRFETRELVAGTYRVRINHGGTEALARGTPLVHAAPVEVPPGGIRELTIVPVVEERDGGDR